MPVVTTTMPSPTSVDFRPRQLESVDSEPKKKRIKTTTPPPVPEASPVDPDLQGLPSELMANVLIYLIPSLDHPAHSECSLINLARVSKRYRALALGDEVWKRICKGRWKTKVGFASRMAKAEAEAQAEAEADDADTLVKGSYWYRKFFSEERDAPNNDNSR